jgi:hypothetical protein
MMKSTARRIMMLPAVVLRSLAGACAASPQMPTFFARYDYHAPSQYSNFIQVADTNGDGSQTSWHTRFLFGNGNGTFRSGPRSQILNVGGTIRTAPQNHNRAPTVYGCLALRFRIGEISPVHGHAEKDKAVLTFRIERVRSGKQPACGAVKSRQDRPVSLRSQTQAGKTQGLAG